MRREIVLAMKDQKKMTPAIEKFIEYLKYRKRIPAI